MIRIAPSILSADFARLGEALRIVTDAGADVIHLDVMDGHFVPNLTIGPPVVAALRKETALPFDCHLMIEEPLRYVGDFLSAGANMISIHIEADRHIHRTLQAIRAGGAKAGIAINPATALDAVTDAIDFCDFVLVMSVSPGFGGQKFITPVVSKIRRLRDLIIRRNLNIEIEVDGGIDRHTAPLVIGAGAEILVAGSAIFSGSDPAEAIRNLRSAVTGPNV